jgi:hypothetical protein
MRRIAIFTSASSSQDAMNLAAQWISQLDSMFGYPNQSAQTYALPLKHPDVHLYESAVPIDDRADPYLPSNVRVITEAQSYQEGWFLGPLNR